MASRAGNPPPLPSYQAQTFGPVTLNAVGERAERAFLEEGARGSSRVIKTENLEGYRSSVQES